MYVLKKNRENERRKGKRERQRERVKKPARSLVRAENKKHIPLQR
jgi:hypothetical protein